MGYGHGRWVTHYTKAARPGRFIFLFTIPDGQSPHEARPLTSVNLKSNIEKQIKKLILGTPQTALVRFPRGWHDVCVKEIQSYFDSPVVALKFNPVIDSDGSTIRITNIGYRNLIELTFRMTTARDILWIIHEGRVGSVGELIEHVRKIPLKLIIPPDLPLGLRVTSTASRVYHEQLIAEVVADNLHKDGIKVVPRAETAALLDVRILENHLTIALSLAGDPLYKRGYKTKLAGLASVKEDLAAAAISFATDWVEHIEGGHYRPDEIYVPFAGSGTLGFESLIHFDRIPPIIFGRELSCNKFVCTPERTVVDVQRRLKKTAGSENSSARLTFVELAADQVATLQLNTDSFVTALRQAGLRGPEVQIHAGDYAELQLELAANVFMPLNPPYGQRLGRHSKTGEVYREIGEYAATLGAQRLVSGFILAPDRLAQEAFLSGLRGFRTNARIVLHGGKKISVLAFVGGDRLTSARPNLKQLS